MTKNSSIQKGCEAASELRACDVGWRDIHEELERSGVMKDDLPQILRTLHAWDDEAKFLKRMGYPFDEIVGQLLELSASWRDIVGALMALPLSPADVLRIMLPCAETQVQQIQVVQSCVCGGPEDVDYFEVNRLLEYYRIPADAAIMLDSLSAQKRSIFRRRLGIKPRNRVDGFSRSFFDR